MLDNESRVVNLLRTSCGCSTWLFGTKCFSTSNLLVKSCYLISESKNRGRGNGFCKPTCLNSARRASQVCGMGESGKRTKDQYAGPKLGPQGIALRSSTRARKCSSIAAQHINLVAGVARAKPIRQKLTALSSGNKHHENKFILV